MEDEIATARRDTERKRDRWEALVRHVALRREQGASAEDVSGLVIDAERLEREYAAARRSLLALEASARGRY